MNKRKLYYLQQMGLTVWLPRTDKILNWKACFMIEDSERETGRPLAESIAEAIKRWVPGIDSIQFVSRVDELNALADEACLCYDFDSGLSQSLLDQLNSNNRAHRVIEFPSLSKLASSSTLKKKVWKKIIDQAVSMING